MQSKHTLTVLGFGALLAYKAESFIFRFYSLIALHEYIVNVFRVSIKAVGVGLE